MDVVVFQAVHEHPRDDGLRKARTAIMTQTLHVDIALRTDTAAQMTFFEKHQKRVFAVF